LIALLLASTFPSAAFSQETDAPPASGHLKAAGNLSFTHSSQVIGSPDGLTLQLGGTLDAGATVRRGRHEWQNGLLLAEGQTKSPILESFLKTTDSLEVDTTYLWHWPGADWFGPFARIHLTTTILPGYHVQPEDVDVVTTFTDGGTASQTLPGQTRLELTGPFEPLVLRESAGAFGRLDRGPPLFVDVKLGPAVQEIFARDGFVVADDPDTPTLEVHQLQSSVETGVELAGDAKGAVGEMLTWSIKANFFYPLTASIDTDVHGLSRMNASIQAKVSAKLTGWASVDYLFTATRVPLVLDAWQVQNGLVFAFSVDLAYPPPPPPPCPPGCVPPA
jgi:hypothetical protein